MPSGVLRRHTRDRLESLSRLVKPSDIEGPFPLSAEDYQDLLDLVLDFPDLYRKAVDAEVRKIFTERSRTVEQLQQARLELEETADRYVAMVLAVEEDPALRKLAGQDSLFPPILAKLGEAVAMLQREKARLVEEWPVCSPEELARVPEEWSAEKFLPADRAFAEMKGITAEELHRRLEEHKAKRREYGWE